MATPESKLKREIMDVLQHYPALECWYSPNHGIKGRVRHSKYERNGISDISGIWNGRYFGVEVKAPGVKCRNQQQLEFIRMVNLNGGFAMTTDSVEFLIDAMNAHAKEMRWPTLSLRVWRGVD